MAEKGLSIDVEFPHGLLDPSQLPPPEKLLPHEFMTEDQFHAATPPVLCANGHCMMVINVVPVNILAKHPDVPDLVKVVGHYCETCDRYKNIGVKRP